MDSAILLSGGIDSAALAFWKKPRLAITVDYGQHPADAEIQSATIIARELGIEHQVVRTKFRELGSGLLAGTPQVALAPSPEWWPYRNQLLVTIGAMAAICKGCSALIIGTVASDHLHADGTREFVSALDALLGLQEGSMRLSAPALDMTSAELVEVSAIPDALLAWCHSCHTGDLACGHCRGCVKNEQTKSAVLLRHHDSRSPS
jgi:7-cyano-7-deazaguanine synthase